MTNFEPLISCKHTQDTSSNVFYHLSSVNPTGYKDYACVLHFLFYCSPSY
ncbi:hypothetical protein Fmac_015778 [Flemingia macrophylla]|uniref:Uncharacterized protein n=1 Tax=Flemingia macrophylla TaxID=520843 RepID=A0ABD1MHM4_9FABA